MITVALSIMRDVMWAWKSSPTAIGSRGATRADATEQLALAVVRVLGDHRAVEREERGVAAAAHRADDGLGHVLVGATARRSPTDARRAATGTTISAPAFCATPRNPPSCVLVSRNSSIAAAPASGRNDASGVGTGENVLVSCIIIATTIFRRAMCSVLSPRVPGSSLIPSATLFYPDRIARSLWLATPF